MLLLRRQCDEASREDFLLAVPGEILPTKGSRVVQAAVLRTRDFVAERCDKPRPGARYGRSYPPTSMRSLPPSTAARRAPARAAGELDEPGELLGAPPPSETLKDEGAKP